MVRACRSRTSPTRRSTGPSGSMPRITMEPSARVSTAILGTPNFDHSTALMRPPPRALRRHDLAGIHDVLRIERALEQPHHVDLDRRFVVHELADFAPADAVLGRDAAVHPRDDVVHDAVDLFPAGEEGLALGPLLRLARGLAHVEMDIAVADMAESDRPDAGYGALHGGGRFGDERGDRGYRHRDVVLDAAALGLLRFRDAVP